jgi:2-polyprenyl-3-methyl-5-hydroxy-6-metoxy-1,4-benzoquinol methylase
METHPVELSNNLLHLERTKIISDMVVSLDNDLVVLDVGCGNGAICSPIREKGNNVTCVELRGVAPLTRHCGVHSVIGGDAENLAFSSEIFDLVLASEVVEHLWNPQNFFNEACRILKTDGHLIISTPEGKMGLCYDAHKHYFTAESLMQMLGKKFKLCQAKHLKANGEPAPTLIASFRKSTTN